jgi:hypothetical protein
MYRALALQRSRTTPELDEPISSSLDKSASSDGDGWSHRLIIAMFFVVLTVINTYPLARTPESVIGRHGDAFFSVWRLAWVAHQIRTDPLHLFNANIFYPERRTLAYSDAMLLPGLLLAPLHWAGIDPVAVYNVTLMSAFVLSALAAYALVRSLTGSMWAGLLAGVIFAFSPHRFDHFDHLELQFAFWIPLTALAWHRAVVRGTPRSALLVAALATCQVLSCIYLGVFLLTWLAALTAIWYVRTPAKLLKTGAVMLAPAVVVLAIYSLPYLGNRGRLGDRPTSEIAHYSAEATDFLSAPASNLLYGWTDPIGIPERHLFPGIVAVVLLVVGLWPPVNRVRLLHVAMLALAFQLTLGFNGYIYRFLYEWVLPFRGLRVPARADILIVLGTAVLAGFGFARLTARIRRPWLRTALAATILLAASIEYLAAPSIGKLEARPSVWYSWLRTMPDAVLFEWPVTVPSRLNMIDVNYMYRSTMHWRPLLNGYSGYYPPSYIRLLLRMRTFPDKGSLKYLRRIGATVLVVHDVPKSRPSYAYTLERLNKDPNIHVMFQGWDAGSRVTFFRLENDPKLARR